jgi:predicted permease
MNRTLSILRQVQPGFTQPEELQTFRISIPKSQAAEEMVPRVYHDILEKLRAIPGVSSAGFTNSITMDNNNNNDPIFAEDRVYSESQLPPLRRFKYVSPELFSTMGNPLMAGRDVTWTDIFEKRPVVLISENLARELWKTPAAAVGKRIRENPKGTWREVIGVVGNERDNGVQESAPTIVYWPIIITNYWGEDVRAQRSIAFAVRSSRTGSASFLSELRAAVWSVNPDLPIAGVRTVKDIYDRSMARTSFTLVMLSIAGGMALLLGVVGIYGVIAYSVSQRTREIGIRMALGAQHEQVRRMFVRHGLLLTGIGLMSGLAAAAALTRLLSSLLFGVSPLDPVTFGLVSVVLGSAALLASYVPARRATVVDPVEALRAE